MRLIDSSGRKSRQENIIGSKNLDIKSLRQGLGYRPEKVAYIFLTDRSKELAQYTIDISKDREKESVLVDFRDFKSDVAVYFHSFEYLVFVMATGIVIRTIAPFIKDKFEDPAVIVMDELGINVISILGGHIAGANEVTNYIAEKLGANPVITTATDINSKGSFDMLVKKLGSSVDGLRDLSLKYNSDILKGQGPYLYVDPEIESVISNMGDWERLTRGFKVICSEDFLYEKSLYEKFLGGKFLREEFLFEQAHDKQESNPVDLNTYIDDGKDESRDTCDIIVISDKLDLSSIGLKGEIIDKHRIVKLVPRINVLGLGCRKNIDSQDLASPIEDYLEGLNIDRKSIDLIGTIDIKIEEEAIANFCIDNDIDRVFFTSEELDQYESLYEKSDFVKRITGTYSVAQPSCHILCDGNIIGKKYKKDGVTISLGRYRRWNR